MLLSYNKTFFIHGIGTPGMFLFSHSSTLSPLPLLLLLLPLQVIFSACSAIKGTLCVRCATFLPLYSQYIVHRITNILKGKYKNSLKYWCMQISSFEYRPFAYLHIHCFVNENTWKAWLNDPLYVWSCIRW